MSALAPGTVVVVRVPGMRERIGRVTHAPRNGSVRCQLWKIRGGWEASGRSYSTRFVSGASSDDAVPAEVGPLSGTWEYAVGVIKAMPIVDVRAQIAARRTADGGE